MFRPASRKMLLALEDTESEADKESLVVCGISYTQKGVEPAGKAFHTAHEKPIIDSKRKGKKPEVSREGSDEEAAEDAKWRKKNKGKDSDKKEGKGKAQGSLKLSTELEGVDLYATLEVSEAATEDQIKKQYRAMALKHHPDKVKAEASADATSEDKDAKGLSEADKIFVRIQGAYEILSDQSKRRQYDSTLDFDESVPEEVDAKVGFYKTFLSVFHRNARFSLKRPVPELGDDTTDIEKVHKFYDWWYNFESWRDFSVHGEHNLEDADSREERRWMEKQNQRDVKKYDQEERKRLLHLVEVAERLDPRVRAEREEKEAKKREEKEARARVKQEEEDAKRRKVEEKQKQEEQEQADKEEKELLEREQRKQGKEVLKRLRQRLKKSLQGQGKCDFNSSETEELQEWALSFEDAGPLEALCARIEALKSAKAVAAAVRSELIEWRKLNASEKEKEDKQRDEARKVEEQKTKEAKEAAAAAATGKEWEPKELGVLAKGLQKFPGGFGGRWAAIAQLLNSAGHDRTEQEVVAKVKEMSDGNALRSMGSTLSQSFQAPSAKAKATPKAAPAAEKVPEKPAAEEAPAASAEWSTEQQKALETALQKFPATLDKNERWKLVAEDVPGKSKKECVERFKFIREQMKK